MFNGAFPPRQVPEGREEQDDRRQEQRLDSSNLICMVKFPEKNYNPLTGNRENPSTEWLMIIIPYQNCLNSVYPIFKPYSHRPLVA